MGYRQKLTTSKIMKIFYFIGIILIISSCNQEKVESLESELERKSSEVLELKIEIEKLNFAITNLEDDITALKLEVSKIRHDTDDEIIGIVKGSSATKEVTIGKQVWMTQNLNVEQFRNGDPIPQAKTNEEWEKAGNNQQPAWCYYENDPANGAKYGKLYNWYAVNDSRGLAPKGWHVPSDAEWTQLIVYLGGESVASKKMKYTDFWADNDGESGNGTNESGCSGLPGSCRTSDTRIIGSSMEGFFASGLSGYWWSSTERHRCFAHGLNGAWKRSLYSDESLRHLSRCYDTKRNGLSVRCLRD